MDRLTERPPAHERETKQVIETKDGAVLQERGQSSAQQWFNETTLARARADDGY